MMWMTVYFGIIWVESMLKVVGPTGIGKLKLGVIWNLACASTKVTCAYWNERLPFMMMFPSSFTSPVGEGFMV